MAGRHRPVGMIADHADKQTAMPTVAQLPLGADCRRALRQYCVPERLIDDRLMLALMELIAMRDLANIDGVGEQVMQWPRHERLGAPVRAMPLGDDPLRFQLLHQFHD